MNIHEIIDRLEAWVSRGNYNGARAYSIMVHTGFPHMAIFIHLRPEICLQLKENDSILRLIG